MFIILKDTEKHEVLFGECKLINMDRFDWAICPNDSSRKVRDAKCLTAILALRELTGETKTQFEIEELLFSQ